MKKILIPAIVIAAVGGYLYYQNLQRPNLEPATAEAVIAEEIVVAAEEVNDEGTAAPGDFIAVTEGDVFADVAEAMDEPADAMADENVEEIDSVKE